MAKKIALVHDYIKEYGGAERVLETLHEMYPDAPVFTLVYAPQFLGPHKARFANWDIRSSFLQNVPFSYKFISLYRLIAPLVFKTFNFSGFDVVIVSATGAYCPNVIRTKRDSGQVLQQVQDSERNRTARMTKHICYCHTPPRYLYGYATAREKSQNVVIQALTAIMVHILRIVDYYSSKNVDVFIANSENVKKRIEKFYRKDAIVVYPPVDVPRFEKKDSSTSLRFAQNDTREYFLAGGRLARPKHIDLIVKACTELGVELKVFGKSFAGYGEELENIVDSSYRHSGKRENRANPESLRDPGQTRMTRSSIEFLGEVSDEEKLQLMKGAKAFIFAAEDEDFGIVPVEAMGQGIPVIAYRSGGVLETVVDGKTGVFFDELTVESLKSALKKFEKMQISKEACYNQAKKFGKEEFVKKINNIIALSLRTK